MTRKDFELIAATLREMRRLASADATAGDLWNETVLAFAASLKSTNKQFNADKFKRACGPNAHCS